MLVFCILSVDGYIPDTLFLMPNPWERRVQKMGEQYIRVHTAMLTELNLHSNDVLVYAYIHSFCQQSKDKICYAAQTTIAEWLNIAPSTVYRCINRLVDLGLVTKHYNVYTDKLEYKALKIYKNDNGAFFNVFAAHRDTGLSGNALLIYAYLRKSADITKNKLAALFSLSLNCICNITNNLCERGLLAKKQARTAYGKFKNMVYTLLLSKKQQNEKQPETTTIKATDKKSVSKKPLKSNDFNRFMQHNYSDADLDALEKAILAN